MRVRTSLILDETLLAQIDEIAGEKHRRAAVIENALRDFIARESKKPITKPTNGKVSAASATRR
jgi:metal-responsive CopG/Arc/MetJ family transcriptional regulator